MKIVPKTMTQEDFDEGLRELGWTVEPCEEAGLYRLIDSEGHPVPFESPEGTTIYCVDVEGIEVCVS